MQVEAKPSYLDGRVFEVLISERELKIAAPHTSSIWPSFRDKPSVWLRWLADIAEANNQ